MTILYLLIPLGLLLLAIAVGAFFWATRSGQFDDLDTPGWTVVMDDDRKPRSEKPGTGENRGQAPNSSAKTRRQKPGTGTRDGANES